MNRQEVYNEIVRLAREGSLTDLHPSYSKLVMMARHYGVSVPLRRIRYEWTADKPDPVVQSEQVIFPPKPQRGEI